MRIALDTNVLAYAEGIEEGDPRARAALTLVRELPRDSVVIPVLVLGELYNVLVRKARIPRGTARDAVLGWTATRAIARTNEVTFLAAIDVATEHQLTIWDAIIVATAVDARCEVLLSEDMHHGFAWGGVTVVNPFAIPRHPLLEIALGGRAT